MSEFQMVDAFFWSLMAKMAFPIMGAIFMWLLLKIFDKLGGRSWTDDVWETMKDDPKALALYYGARIVAFGIYFGLAIS